MKVLISNAVWGDSYCSIFTRFSLASLLSPGNIPALAQKASITCHIVTTERDRDRLLREPAIDELMRHCAIEWEIIENFGFHKPPTGPGGEKYPFLSALQNIAIARSLDHDAVAFNYADFIWADGSLTAAVDMLVAGGAQADAVMAFCLPVDRDWALPALETHRLAGASGVIDLPPRDAARLVVERMHREARLRLWDGPFVTNLPTYLMWPVDGQGVLLRAYHQSILAMRVRSDDPRFRHGILRGSLDSSFGGQLAKSGSVCIANDTDKILVFSLYHTPVDSRLPPGVTREMSLRSVLQADVLPEQRRLAEFPFFFRLRDGDEAKWKSVAEKSWRILEEVQRTTEFDQAVYDQHLATHGVVPPIKREDFVVRRVIVPCRKAIDSSIALALGSTAKTFAARRAVITSQSGLRATILRQLANTEPARDLKRAITVLCDPVRRRASIRYRVNHLLGSISGRLKNPEAQLVAGHGEMAVLAFAQQLEPYEVAPNISVNRFVRARFAAAVLAEDMASRVDEPARLLSALRTGETLLRQAMADMPIWAELPRALGRNLWFQGRFDESIAAFADGEKLRDEMARAAGWPVDDCVFLPRNCTEIIGLMGHIDAFVKYKILTNDPRPYYLLAGPQKIVNPAFLDYWKPYINVVTDPGEIAKLAAREPVYAVNWNWVMPRGGKIAYVHPGMAETHRAWQRAGRGPLLQLRDEHRAVLERVRAKWRMRDTDRFVCLHVRSIGFYGAAREAAQQFRNLSIDTYYPLIRMLTDSGYWVIRMGDPSMPPLDRSQCGDAGRVIDYAHSTDKSPELDVALCASCALFVSSPSGLHTVAHAFGRPVCEVDYPIYEGFPWHPGDIFIPQLYFSREKGRFLSLEEILGTDVLHCDHQFLLERAGISLVPNRPDDIVETVREALAPAEYRVKDEALADKVCDTFDNLNRRYHRSISGRLGRYFAAKYADYLVPDRSLRARRHSPPRNRKLDFLLSVYNRPRYLHHILATALALDIPGAYFVVFDDASDTVEDVPGLGPATVEMVCRSFNDPRVIYVRNPTNMGVAKSLQRYYREVCDAEYTSLLNPKDEFIDGAPIREALAKLDADPKISFVVYPLRQVDRDCADRPLLFHYERMSGRNFIAAHVRDEMLQHCGAYSIMRVAAARKVGIPRNMDLRADGLEDASGFDHDMIFMMATTGDVDFVDTPPIRRAIAGGYTERFPLTFAYCQYQYARRLMAELEPKGFVTAETRRKYLSFWHLIIARGLVVAYRHVHGSELEQGVTRIRPHMQIPILLYLPLECLRFRVPPRLETITTYMAGAKLLIMDWMDKLRAWGNSAKAISSGS